MKKVQWSLCLILSVITVARANITVKVAHGPAADNYVPHTITLTSESEPLGPYTAGASFPSFCVEIKERFYETLVYDVTLNDAAVEGGVLGGSDPLDPRAAWLYTKYLDNPSLLKASEVQNAIWYIEQESSAALTSTATNYFDQADTAVSGGWTNPGVWVMNLTRQDGGRAQDQLVFIPAVPAPGAVLLAGLGAYIVSRRRWRTRYGS